MVLPVATHKWNSVRLLSKVEGWIGRSSGSNNTIPCTAVVVVVVVQKRRWFVQTTAGGITSDDSSTTKLVRGVTNTTTIGWKNSIQTYEQSSLYINNIFHILQPNRTNRNNNYNRYPLRNYHYTYFNSQGNYNGITAQSDTTTIATTKKNPKPASIKKKLKKNQLGQKGQNRTLLRKEKEKKEQQKEVVRNYLQRQESKKQRKRSKSLLKLKEQLHQNHPATELKEDNNEINKEDAINLIKKYVQIESDNNNNDDKQHVEIHNNEHSVKFQEQDPTDSLSETNDSIHPPQESPVTQQIKRNIKRRPPTLLATTGSPNVFIAKIACEQMGSNPKDLFTSLSDIPPAMFRNGYFEYFPAASFEELPSVQQPEVAFLGRSNVGKSSLINAILRRQLAVTSKQPGRTQQAYYYGLVKNGSNSNSTATTTTQQQNKELQNSAIGFVIDLPGYGYAVGPDEIIDEWQRRTQQFLLQRRDAGSLKRLFLLQDARTGALPLDLSIQNWFDEAAIPYSIVLTKIDCVGPATLLKHVNLACARYHHRFSEIQATGDDSEFEMSPFVYATSAKHNYGITELLYTIETEFKS